MNIKLDISYCMLPVFIGIIIVCLTSGCNGDDGTKGPSNSNTKNCGNVQDWDSDGDGISNSIENNNLSEGYHPELHKDTICNSDLSCAGGLWNDNAGCIDLAYNLTDNGTGYYHYNPDGYDIDDWGTLDLLNVIEAAGRDWGDGAPLMQVGDLSLRYGGIFSSHPGSHRNGLEYDVRYVTKDGLHQALDISDPIQQQQYDTTSTKMLIATIINAAENSIGIDVVWIFVDMNHLGFDNSDIEACVGHSEIWLNDEPDHSDHFHVRFEDRYTSTCNCE